MQLSHVISPHNPRITRDVPVVVLCGIALVLMFIYMPAPNGVYVGDDWAVFRNASIAVLNGESLYHVDFAPIDNIGMYYYNPPWLAVALTPLAALPERLGWAILSAATLAGIVALLWRWSDGSPGIARPLMAILSPFTMQALIHGQIDVLLMLTVFLPSWLWPAAMTVKPQATAALLSVIPRRHWRRAAIVSAALFAASLLWFGWWPSRLLATPVSHTDNLFSALWPLTIIPAGILIAYAYRRQDERAAVLASPLLAPYVRTHTLIGAWIALVAILRPWQAALVWALSWAWMLGAI